MQFGNSDNLHHLPEISCRPPGVVRSFSRWAGKLFSNPLTYIALVWGLMFLILGVTLAYAQGAGPIVNQQRIIVSPRAATDHAVSDKKTEVVEIFSVGEDPVIPSPTVAVKNLSRRRAVVAQRRARR